MIATRHTQSLTDFRQNATETLERLGKTGEAELITVNGEAKAVMMSPAAFDEMARELQTIRDVESIRISMKEFAEGKGIDAREAFARMREELMARLNKGEGKVRR